MKTPPDGGILELLVCEIGVRPANAPTFEDVAPHVRALVRDADAITIDFDDAAHAAVQQLAAAERLCCAGIDWQVSIDPLRLRIGAAPAQLDVLEQMLRQPA